MEAMALLLPLTVTQCGEEVHGLDERLRSHLHDTGATCLNGLEARVIRVASPVRHDVHSKCDSDGEGALLRGSAERVEPRGLLPARRPQLEQPRQQADAGRVVSAAARSVPGCDAAADGGDDRLVRPGIVAALLSQSRTGQRRLWMRAVQLSHAKGQ